jgi:FkbM family methyltransferase
MWCSKVSARPIMAFEPEPATFDVLRRNIELNGLQNATVSNLACGDSDGIIYFHAGPNGYTLLPDRHHFSEEDEGVIQVRCQKLDSIVQDRRVAFIKMDVEGHEWHALRGAAEIIKRDRPALLIEIHPVYLRDRGKSAEEVLSLLKNSYERIELYAPRDRPKSALANFMSRYRTKRIPLRIEEPDFLEQVGRKSPPLQLYAVCKA